MQRRKRMEETPDSKRPLLSFDLNDKMEEEDESMDGVDAEEKEEKHRDERRQIPHLDPNFVNDVALHLDVDINEDVAVGMSGDLNFRLRKIVLDAQKIMKRSKRTRLSCQDVFHAIDLKNIEPHVTFPREIHKDPHWFIKSADHTANLVPPAADDVELDLDQMILTSNMLPSPIEHTTMNIHWLALDGVQPTIPENPIPDTSHTKSKKDHLIPSYASHQLSKELQLYYDKVIAVIRACDPKLVRAALEGIVTDIGLQPLVPYFSRYIIQEVLFFKLNFQVEIST
eukprot:TRINITY_DN5646_c0_g1_i2.p1 TRINITY_DN5646_c0_g1~~TRINITY_DN5646_c0_g1_i2.p1  ORF type:complete len:284 (-),score=74.72 TRINITY_DN5646_c0_g1_i2:684-1535(-)